MKWILLWAIITWDGVGTSSVQFDSQEACEIAANSIRAMEGRRLVSATAKCFKAS